MAYGYVTRATARAALLAGAALLALAAPVAAAETRHCNVEVRLVPQNASQTWRSFEFSVQKTVDSLLQVNQARRDARGRAIQCIRDHWADRESGLLPTKCTDTARFHIVDYPFGHIRLDVNRALCEANPDISGPMYLTIELHISGNDGCYFGGSHDPVVIASNQRILCLRPSEARPSTDEPPPAEDPAAEAPPPIGDAGGWDCVGEGCDGDDGPGAEPEDEADDAAPPAAASYLPLPAIRLPGNDLYLIELDAPNWMLCRQACTDDARCGAWTYRNPTGASGPICLIKSRAGVPIPDPCCRSGIKQ
jgi:PAN domain